MTLYFDELLYVFRAITYEVSMRFLINLQQYISDKIFIMSVSLIIYFFTFPAYLCSEPHLVLCNLFSVCVCVRYKISSHSVHFCLYHTKCNAYSYLAIYYTIAMKRCMLPRG